MKNTRLWYEKSKLNVTWLKSTTDHLIMILQTLKCIAPRSHELLRTLQAPETD